MYDQSKMSSQYHEDSSSLADEFLGYSREKEPKSNNKDESDYSASSYLKSSNSVNNR